MINKTNKKEYNEDNKDSYTARHLIRKSMFDFKHKNIFNKLAQKAKNPSLVVGSLNYKSKLEKIYPTDKNSLNSTKLVTNVNSNTIKNSRKSLNQGIIRKKGTKKVNKVKFNKFKLSEDEQFLHELLFQPHQKSTNTNTNINNNKNDKDNKDNINKINYSKYRNYIIKNQNNFNQEFELFYLNNFNNENDDVIQIKKLEDLFARYCIIIYFLLKISFKEAKTLFLLMIKENEKYIDLFEYKIYKTFSKLERKISLLKVFPRTGLSLLKIFASIIKYSVVFNKIRHKNIFLFRYLALHSLNYRVFRTKCEIRGFTTETKNNIKYWFSSGLHYASYFSLCNYSPLKIPISLSELILKVYKNADESILNKSEKSLLVNTSYNNSFLIYANNQGEQALKSLDETKQRIISYYEETNVKNFNNLNNLYNNASNINNSNISILNTSNITFDINSYNNNNLININPLKRSLFGKHRKKTFKENLNNSFIGPGEIIEKIDKIVATNKKNSIRMDNINSLFLVELQKNYNRNSDKSLSLLENNFENFLKFKNENEVYSTPKKSINDLTERNSNISVKPLLDIKNYEIPKYMKNPLLIKIELLMCEIEIDKKNFFAAYEHIKTSIIIMFIMKNFGEIKLYENFKEEIRIMLTYLSQIEELNDIKIKKKQKSVLQKKNKNKSNKGLMFSNDKLNLGNNSFNHIVNNSLDYNNYNNYSNNNNYNYKNNSSVDIDNSTEYQKGFLAEEIEKFFIFLSSLSIYQLKLLNDFQPKTKNKNDLPILFHSQFKDSLTGSQRITLENLHTVTLSRYMILEDPDKPILPTNLKFKILNIRLKSNKNKYNKVDNFSFNNNNFNFSKDTNEDDINSIENEPVYDIGIKTKEHEIFQKIILSKNNNIDLRKFLFKNYEFAIKILKESNEKEIEKIIENPKIIVEPIKIFLKNNKNAHSKIFSMSMNRQCFKLNDYNYLFRNSSANKEVKNRLSKNPQRKRMKSSFYSIDDFSFAKMTTNKQENSRRLSFSRTSYE